MNIFNLPIEEAEKEIDKLLNSIPKERLIQKLEECGLEVIEKEKIQ